MLLLFLQDKSYASTEPPQKRPSRRPLPYPSASECIPPARAVMDMPCPGLNLAQEPEPVLPMPVHGTAGSDGRKAQALKVVHDEFPSS